MNVFDRVVICIAICGLICNSGLCDYYMVNQCQHVENANSSGIYSIYPFTQFSNTYYSSREVYCDFESDGGGWTVIQRRGFYPDGQVDFYRSYGEYARGFGNVSGEYWIGNDVLHALSNQGKLQLRIDLWDFEGNHKFAKYESFSVAGWSNKYRLQVSGYTGNASDSMAIHNGMMFSASDEDNDVYPGNCAIRFKGGWWYEKCHYANLNGEYLAGYHSSYADGIDWYYWKGYHYSLKAVEMKVKLAN